MATVVKVDDRTTGRRRRGAGRGSVVVTVRYDGGVTEEVTLAPGDAEVCGDDELSPVVGQVIDVSRFFMFHRPNDRMNEFGLKGPVSPHFLVQKC